MRSTSERIVWGVTRLFGISVRLLVFVVSAAFLNVRCTPAPDSVNKRKLETSEVQIEEGRKLATSKTCTTCHSLTGQPGVGPTLMHLYGKEETLSDGTRVIVDEAYLRESILNPGAKVVARFAPTMPAIPLSETEMSALIALIRSLKKK